MKLKIGKCLFGLAALLLFGLSSNAFAKSKTIVLKGSGTLTFNYSGSDPVTTPDGPAPTVYSDVKTGIGTDNQAGSFLLTGTDSEMLTGATCTTTNGTPGVTWAQIQSQSVRTDIKTASQLDVFSDSQLNPTNTYCNVPSTGAQSGTYVYEIEGGSGIYAQATGTITVTFVTEITSGDLSSGTGAQQWTYSGRITVP
jgi:hypothetical protein